MIPPVRFHIVDSKLGDIVGCPHGEWVYYSAYADILRRWEQQRQDIREMRASMEALKDELCDLEHKVEWYKKADRLVIWNGTEWQVRHDAAKEGR